MNHLKVKTPRGVLLTDGDNDCGVYVHFPYCVQKCPYCDFNSYAVRDRNEERGRTYLRAVLSELDARGEALEGLTLRSIFFGGGTPSLWAPECVAAVVERVLRLFARQLAPYVEVTLEANPSAVETQALGAFKAAGVTRVSMGVQALSEPLLKTLGRAHSAGDARAALAAIQAAGFDSHSIDLIYGIPGQSEAMWAQALDEATTFATPHLSAYSLIYEPQTPFDDWRRRGALKPLGEEQETALFLMTRARLEAAGLQRYEVSNFAREGHESIHNRLYWRSRYYLGVGAGAHSFLPAKQNGFAALRCENARQPERYVAAWGAQATPFKPAAEEWREQLRSAQVADEHILSGLRTAQGWNAALTERELGLPARQAAQRAALCYPKWCAYEDGFLKPVRDGWLMNNALILACARLLAADERAGP